MRDSVILRGKVYSSMSLADAGNESLFLRQI